MTVHEGETVHDTATVHDAEAIGAADRIDGDGAGGGAMEHDVRTDAGAADATESDEPYMRVWDRGEDDVQAAATPAPLAETNRTAHSAEATGVVLVVERAVEIQDLTAASDAEARCPRHMLPPRPTRRPTRRATGVIRGRPPASPPTRPGAATSRRMMDPLTRRFTRAPASRTDHRRCKRWPPLGGAHGESRRDPCGTRGPPGARDVGGRRRRARRAARRAGSSRRRNARQDAGRSDAGPSRAPRAGLSESPALAAERQGDEQKVLGLLSKLSENVDELKDAWQGLYDRDGARARSEREDAGPG